MGNVCAFDKIKLQQFWHERTAWTTLTSHGLHVHCKRLWIATQLRFLAIRLDLINFEKLFGSARAMFLRSLEEGSASR